ncbi:hypothetical protein L3Y34_002687 [Caenorhabditis briggsae]|uniref:K Homology domain-containing protein n=1 Tax=Caenorhabditis briggsae TaxID=6238 RepID=A0AAE9ISV4_CAEBR|nr:hypothetical protein L3Y34_002687 [Caenorhabditis briggsae]
MIENAIKLEEPDKIAQDVKQEILSGSEDMPRHHIDSEPRRRRRHRKSSRSRSPESSRKRKRQSSELEYDEIADDVKGEILLDSEDFPRREEPRRRRRHRRSSRSKSPESSRKRKRRYSRSDSDSEYERLKQIEKYAAIDTFLAKHRKEYFAMDTEEKVLASYPGGGFFKADPASWTKEEVAQNRRFLADQRAKRARSGSFVISENYKKKFEKRLKKLERKCNCSLEVRQERGYQGHYSICIEGNEDEKDLEKAYDVIDKFIFKQMDKEYERSKSIHHYWYLFPAETRNVEGFGRRLYELGNRLGISAYQHGKHVSTPIHFEGSPDRLRGIRGHCEQLTEDLKIKKYGKIIRKFPIQKKFVGKIIGPQGTVIREISEWTGARLTVGNVEVDGCNELEIRGNSEERVEIAEKHILRILRENGG